MAIFGLDYNQAIQLNRLKYQLTNELPVELNCELFELVS